MAEFSARDKLIAYTLQFDAGEPLGPLAKRLNLREHVVRYALQRMLDAGAMREVAWLDTFRLGFLTHHVRFSVAGTERQERALVSHIGTSPWTGWFAELGGQFRYGTYICSPSLRDFASFLDSLDAKFGSIIVNKQIATHLSFTMYTKRYLAPNGPQKEVLRIGVNADPIEVDELDCKIIGELLDARVPSAYEIATRLKVPRSTVQARIARLRKDGAIRRMLYFVSASVMGAQTYKVYMSTKGDRSAATEALFTFSRGHPSIVDVATCLGAWDYDLTVEVLAPEDMGKLLSELNRKLADYLDRVEVLPVFRQMQSPFFLRDGALMAGGGRSA